MENESNQQKKVTNKDETNWAVFCHLSALIGFVFPFGNILAPFILWYAKKDEFPFVDDQGKEVLNFQISMTIYILISVLLVFVVIGIPILIVLGIFAIIIIAIGALNAADGKKYRYPFTIKFLDH